MQWRVVSGNRWFTLKSGVKQVLAILLFVGAVAMPANPILDFSVSAKANQDFGSSASGAATATAEALSSAAGWLHVCEVRSNSTLFCKGDNSSGQLGNGTLDATKNWVRVNSGFLRGKSVVAVGTGDYNTCAITAERQLACWGENSDSQLGDGTTTDRTAPKLINSGYLAGKRILSMDGQTTHTCAITMGGKLACWGNNYNGQLGDGTKNNRTVPKLINTGFLADKDVVAVSTGWIHACALTSAGQVACWGSNLYGQLGDGKLDEGSATPQLVNSGFLEGKKVVAISTGRAHSCALTSAGQLACWGENEEGQLGDGTRQTRPLPKLINGGFLAGKQISQISAGWIHNCVITSAAQAACWGNNSAGQLGDGTYTNRRLPVRSPTNGLGVAVVSAGFAFTHLITESTDLINGTFAYDFCTGGPIITSKGKLRRAC